MLHPCLHVLPVYRQLRQRALCSSAAVPRRDVTLSFGGNDTTRRRIASRMSAVSACWSASTRLGRQRRTLSAQERSDGALTVSVASRLNRVKVSVRPDVAALTPVLEPLLASLCSCGIAPSAVAAMPAELPADVPPSSPSASPANFGSLSRRRSSTLMARRSSAWTVRVQSSG